MPIDIATGALHSSYRDILIPGRIPLTWSRTYNSASLIETPLGIGWYSPCFSQLTRIGKDYHFRGPSGSLVIFPDPQDIVERDGTIRDLGSFHEIRRHRTRLQITHWTSQGTITRFFFQPDRNGRWWPLQSIEDAAGDGMEMAWDEQGRLKGIRQKREKRTLVIHHTASGRIAGIAFRSQDGRQQSLIRYDYDAKGRLILAQDPLGHADRFEYDSEGRIIREVAKDGGLFAYRYDDKGRCIRSAGLDNYDLKSLRYLDHIRWTEVTDSLGRTNRYAWSPMGQILMHIDPLGAKTETAYDDFGRMVSKTGPLGEKTTYEYDEQGNRSKTIDAAGGVWACEYNSNHQILRQQDPAGNEWTWSYDAANRPIQAQDPLGQFSRIEFDPAGNPSRLINPNGAESVRTYSEAGDLLSETDFNGHRTSYSRDEFGRIAKRIGPDGKATGYRYDLAGQITQVSYDTGKTVRYEYDAAGNVVKISGAGPKPIVYVYGPCRRLIEKSYGSGNTVRYAWGSEPDMLDKVVNELGEVYRFQYDACDRIIAETGFDGRTTRFKFDLSGRCISRTNNLGETIEWTLDPLGRIVKESIPGQSPAEYSYDAQGNLVKAANGWSELEFSRDSLGRIIGEKQGGFGISRAFGPIGEVLGLSSDAGIKLGFEYDGNGIATRIDANGLGVFEFSRNARGKPEQIGFPGGLRLKQYFDSRDRLLGQSLIRPDASESDSIVSREYDYGDGDSLLGILDSRWGKIRYTHDESRRLIQFVSEAARFDYALNQAGDTLGLIRHGEGETAMAYAAGGALLSQGPIRYEYDDAGRLIGKKDVRKPGESWQYRWDAKNRLLSVKRPDGTLWEYGYDPMGRRCMKGGPDRKIRYIWDQDVLLHEIEAGRETRTWGFEPLTFKPLFRLEKGTLLSIVRDHLGTPRELADREGNIVWSVVFDPWGNPLKGKGALSDCPLRFQGQYYDEESGLHYNRYRYYDPEAGRFISPDPIRLSGGLSAYQYVPNPVHWVDPLGLCGEEDGEPDVLYRTMSEKHYKRFVKTGKMPPTGETFTSLTEAEARKYDGVTVKFTLKPGTIEKLESIGVRSRDHEMTAEAYPTMPHLEDTRNWTENNAYFKEEKGKVNIGLGKGKGLDTFNENITGHEVISK